MDNLVPVPTMPRKQEEEEKRTVDAVRCTMSGWKISKRMQVRWFGFVLGGFRVWCLVLCVCTFGFFCRTLCGVVWLEKSRHKSSASPSLFVVVVVLVVVEMDALHAHFTHTH